MSENVIYTHDEAALIVEMFEKVLDNYGIKIPSPEDDERESDNDAKLYGSVYSDPLDDVESRIIDLLPRVSKVQKLLSMSSLAEFKGVSQRASITLALFIYYNRASPKAPNLAHIELYGLSP